MRPVSEGAFSIDAGASGGQLTEGVLQAIRQLPGITGYNGRSASYAEYLREDGTPLQIRTEGAFQVVEGFEHAGKVVADSFTEKDEFFTEKGFEIEEGSPVTEGGKYAAVIHCWLAEENDLQIGDTILLSLNEQMVSDDVMTGEGIAGKSVQAEIKGIFESTEPQEDEVLLSHVLYENTIFIDVQSYCELFPEGGDAYFESADFRLTIRKNWMRLFSRSGSWKEFPGISVLLRSMRWTMKMPGNLWRLWNRSLLSCLWLFRLSVPLC